MGKAMTDDVEALIARLRVRNQWDRLMTEAGIALAVLLAERERLKAALEPFARASVDLDKYGAAGADQEQVTSATIFDGDVRVEIASVTVGDLRRARAALADSQ